MTHELHGNTPFEEEVLRRLKRIDDAIYGNGREGLIAANARMEERLDGMEEKGKTLWDKVQGLGQTVMLLAYIAFDQKTKMGL